MHAGIPIERLDLKSDEGKARLEALLSNADLFVLSHRPSALARLGLDPESVRSRFPALRTLRIVGSLAAPEDAGHDLTYQAESGILGEGMPRTTAADIMASERVFAMTLALLRMPEGSVVDVGIVDSLEPMIAPLRHGLTSPDGVLGGAASRYRVYPAKHGRVAVAALEPHFEKRLAEALGIAVGADFTALMLERTAEEWETWAGERDLPIVAVREV
jgi:crotonobetainyl-CoA:carnitine CoA-transferase CaiB-like acyl-CoA transferase